MGALTRCNRCSYAEITRQAEEGGNQVTMLLGHSKLGGYDVFVHPLGMDIQKVSERKRRGWFKAWFWALSKDCACHGELSQPDQLAASGRIVGLDYSDA